MKRLQSNDTQNIFDPNNDEVFLDTQTDSPSDAVPESWIWENRLRFKSKTAQFCASKGYAFVAWAIFISIKSSPSEKLKRSMDEEIDSLKKNRSWKLVDLRSVIELMSLSS